MKSEPLHAPVTLLLFKLNIKFKPGTGQELGCRTLQLIEAGLDRCQLRDLFVRTLHPAQVNLSREICSNLPSHQIGWLQQYIRKKISGPCLMHSGQPQQCVLSALSENS